MAKKEERLDLNKDMIRGILSKSFSRTYKKGPVIVGDFKMTPLSLFPTKSAAFRIESIEYEEMPGRVIGLPPYVVFKIYRPEVERASDTELTSCENEYRMEKAMLGISENLECVIGDRNLRVHPIGYSLEVPEADEFMCIVREYITGKSLKELADEKKESLRWEEVRPAITPIALLHANTPWIINDIPNLEKISPEGEAEDFVNYIEKTASAAGKKLDESVKEKIREKFFPIAKKYLCDPLLSYVINGDLGIYPHHINITNGIILDTGSTRRGPFTEDLAFSADPSLANIGDIPARGEKVLEAYFEDKGEINEFLQYPNGTLERMSRDFLITSFLVASLKGSMRRASSIINYKSEYLPEWKKRMRWSKYLERIYIPKKQLSIEEFEREANSFIENTYKLFEFLKQTPDKQDFSELEELVKQAVPSHFKINPVWYRNPSFDVNVYEPVRSLISSAKDLIRPSKVSEPLKSSGLKTGTNG